MGVTRVLEDVEISQRNHPPYRDMYRFLEQDFAVIQKEERIPDKFEPYITARIDIKFSTTTSGVDFRILSMSDKKVGVWKPDWLQKNGMGYVFHSHIGKLAFVAKANVDGQIGLNLRGMWIQNPGDKSNLIPYWIDYTKLTVNEKVIFDKVTPAWHDKPFYYTTDAKADEEIKINVEWLPHRSDSIRDEYNAVIIAGFKRYFTARIDIHKKGKAGDFQIISVSDEKAVVLKPEWFNKNGNGYQIQSYAGKMEVIAKAATSGQINLNLRGLWVQNPDDKSKLIPHWIDYTKLIVNGNVIFDKLTPVWHDKPYRHNFDVKAGDEIKVQVEWLPHRSDV